MVVDVGSESSKGVVIPGEVQSMPLVLEVGGFVDEVSADRAHNTTLLKGSVPHAVELCAALLPLMVLIIFASLYSREEQVRDDVLLESIENLRGHTI